ncbi:ATP-dependent RNA helicase HrpA [Aquisalimonas asiatica]|uniref:RNA helicase n=1 Tax=Aquisalimonas asiatica TaxID=406100 RepID=A0A1H8QC97_9GAMM|nr:ATP-dependent RNA helicase HrpA [Aquisalimonas asiatica]SEO51544.1 ATP-dependent helicase HrpA [Aquisalimonas asiatica]
MTGGGANGDTNSLDTLAERIGKTLAADRRGFRKRLQGLRRRASSGKPYDRGLQQLSSAMDASVALRERRIASLPVPDFSQDLPVNDHREALAEAIRKHQVVVVCGETGSGKSTQLPKICLELGRGVDGMIAHTQPRRLAARTLATRIAEELHSEVGEAVGYRIRFTDRVSDRTHVKLVTDGMLLAEIQGGRTLDAYDTIIIDEAHERSLNIDFLLGYLKQLLPKRPDLKVIITSATIDPERFSRHFDDAPIVHVSGRTYPVEVRYRPLAGESGDDRDRDQQTAIVDAVDELARQGPGDILVFLASEREIRETAEALRKHHPPGTEVLPLFARLSAAEQQRAFQSHAGRRIVLATNVAETSVTVPGIRYVVDTGVVRLSRYSFRTKVQRLPIEPISQASANQRAGRCGREAPGVCIRLYGEDDFLGRPAFTDPEIVRTNLAAVILQMRHLGLGAVEDFPFIQPPDSRYVKDGYRLLHELGAVDGQWQLTDLGHQLARLPVDPTIARMLMAGNQEQSLAEILVIASALSIQDPRERPLEAQQAADQAHAQWRDERSDFLAYVHLWAAYQASKKALSRNKLDRWCRDHFLSPLRMREWSDVHRQLKELVTGMGLRPNTEPADYLPIHRALLAGLLGNVAMRSDEQGYIGPRNLKLTIFPGSALAKKRPKWIAAAEIVETSRVFARTVASIDPREVEQLAGHLVQRTYNEPHWDRRRGRVTAYETVTLYGLPLVTGRKVDYGRVDSADAREVFLRQGLAEDRVDSKGAFLEHNRTLIAEIEALEDKSRRRDVLVDVDRLYAFYAERVPEGISDLRSFEHWRKQDERTHPRRLYLTREALMQHDAATVTAERYPEQLAVGDLRLPLQYHFEPGHPDDGVSLQVPLAALNQLRPDPLEWLVPGLVEEKVTALIRGLPKALRRNFVPAPDFARAALDAISPADGSLTDALRRQLHRMTGVDVPPETWDAVELPDHLIMNIQVLDTEGEVISRGRDLAALQQALGDRASEGFQVATPDPQWEREHITRWDFDALPRTVEFEQHGVTVRGYPALVDAGNTVALRILDSSEAADESTRRGVRRLLRLQLREQVQYLRDNLPGFQQMALQYRGLGGSDALRDDIIDAVVDAVFIGDQPLPADAEAFQAMLEAGRGQLVEEGERFARRVARMLERYHGLKKALKEPRGLEGMDSFRDMNEHLNHLVFPGFLLAHRSELLAHLPRYLDGLQHRVEKQREDPRRDAQRTHQVRPWWEAWVERAARHERDGIVDPELHRFRHLLEEFRISLFAQHLGTATPASEKRLRQQWQAVR